jgi:hypothetical protein
MTVNVSDRLRDALERLDQAIDRLDAQVSAENKTAPAKAPDNAAVVARLDRMIERIETALAD